MRAPTTRRAASWIAALVVATTVAACGGSDDASACGDFRALVDDVQADTVDPTGDEVVERLEGIGDQLQTEGGDLAAAGIAATSAAQTARAFPEDRDEVLAAAVERVDGACS